MTDLPPTEYLVMEVLAARYRLGETHWTFPTRLRPVLRRLETKGLLWWKDGVAERTLTAVLTDQGRAEAMSETYRPPTGVCICIEATWDDHVHCKHDKCCHCDCTSRPVRRCSPSVES